MEKGGKRNKSFTSGVAGSSVMVDLRKREDVEFIKDKTPYKKGDKATMGSILADKYRKEGLVK